MTVHLIYLLVKNNREVVSGWAVIFASWNHAFHARNQDYKKSHTGIKPKHMITNMLKKGNIKYSTYKMIIISKVQNGNIYDTFMKCILTQ